MSSSFHSTNQPVSQAPERPPVEIRCCSHLDMLDRANSKLKVAASELVSKEKEIASLKEKLEEKNSRLSGLTEENRELRRRVQVLGKIWCILITITPVFSFGKFLSLIMRLQSGNNKLGLI